MMVQTLDGIWAYIRPKVIALIPSAGGSGDSIVLPNKKRWAVYYSSGASTPSFLGDNAATLVGSAVGVFPTNTEPYMGGVFTAAVANSEAGYHGLSLVWRHDRTAGQRRNLYFQAYLAPGATITTVRYWFGLTDQTLSTMVSADTPAGNFAGFRFSTNVPDTNWQCVTKDGTTQGVSDSGVAPAGGVGSLFEMIFDDSVPNIVFKINGTVVATRTTNLPTDGTNMRWLWGVETLGAATREIDFAWCYLQEDTPYV